MNNFRRIVLGGVLSLFVTQLLFGGLMFSALYKQYEKPVTLVNEMVCRDIADHFGFLLRAGKKVTPKTASIFLERYRFRTDADHLAVTDAFGNVTARWDAPDAQPVDDTLLGMQGVQKHGGPGAFIITRQPVPGGGTTSSGGSVVAMADRMRVSQQLFDSVRGLLMIFGLVSAGVCGLFLILLFLYRAKQASADSALGRLIRYYPSASLRVCFLSPLLLGQLLFIFLLKGPLTDLYESEQNLAGQHLVNQMQWDLERLSGMGMPLSSIAGMDERMAVCQESAPSIGMAVLDADGQVVSAADRKGRLSPEEWLEAGRGGAQIRADILPTDGMPPVGSVVAVLDPSQMAKSLFSVLLDDLTMTVVAALFLSELLVLLLSTASGLNFSSSPGLMRTVIFASLFATEMATSYVPIRIGELGLDLFGLPPDIVSGLPVSCELFMAGLAMIFGGAWSRRAGWRPMLMTGVMLCCIGSAASSISPSPLPFIFSRGIAGLGYGFINLAAQVFIIAHSDAASRARNLAFMFAGLYAGSLCGSTLGGLIADRLGYYAVFPVSSGMLLILAIVLVVTLPREQWQAEQASGGSALRGLLRFLADRRMGSLLLFLIVPNALVTVCLFQYFVPLSLSRAGVSPASIGRVFMAYCVIVMFAGPVFGAFIDRAKRMAFPLFWSMALAALSIGVLLLIEGIWGAVLSVCVLAVSTAIASNGQGAYALSLPAAERFGRAGTVGVYNVAMRAGQVLGPLSLGIMTSVWNVRSGLAVLAAFAMVSALLFLAFSVGRNKTAEDTV